MLAIANGKWWQWHISLKIIYYKNKFTIRIVSSHKTSMYSAIHYAILLLFIALLVCIAVLSYNNFKTNINLIKYILLFFILNCYYYCIYHMLLFITIKINEFSIKTIAYLFFNSLPNLGFTYVWLKYTF